MLIGLYFGSFNPVHHGHLIIANHIVNSGVANEVWFVVSPQNPFKKAATLLNQNHRLHLVEIAIDGEKNLKASNIEFKLPTPSYTIDTLTYLKEKYPNKDFAVVMGSDGFQNIDKWKNAEVILANYPIIIYKRPGFDINETHKGNIKVLEAPLLEISSTHIRKLIRQKKSIRYLVPDNVQKEIEMQNYYASSLENPA
ncbi:MAG: nicotinate-nucleotide adenylyltransferase [Chitinophagaceae bacterium]|nr:MAG: nicotinate-nucleotide adenylyltransferase [Chitinophagaceae bacterium]